MAGTLSPHYSWYCCYTLQSLPFVSGRGELEREREGRRVHHYLLSTKAYGSSGRALHKSFKMVWTFPTRPRLQCRVRRVRKRKMKVWKKMEKNKRLLVYVDHKLRYHTIPKQQPACIYCSTKKSSLTWSGIPALPVVAAA